MKYLKKFESWELPMSKEDMISHLCMCGWSEDELMDKSDDELHIMCNEVEAKEESYGMTADEMREYLCRCGYPLKELMSKNEDELGYMCMELGSKEAGDLKVEEKKTLSKTSKRMR